MTFLGTAAIILALAYLLVLGVMFVLQRQLVYVPDPKRVSPAAVGLANVKEVELATGDGERLLAWYGAARDGQPTLLYFHGNGGNLAARAPRLERFMAEGYGVFMLSYRGYGGSTGRPSETNNHADALRAYEYLTKSGTPANRIVLYGESLGSGVAVRLASRKPVAGVILDAPFTSLVDVAAHHYPYLPVRLALLDRYNSLAHIASIGAPLLVLHGTNDRTVPTRLGKKLIAAAVEPKSLVLIEGAGHSDIYDHGAFAAVVAFLRRIQSVKVTRDR